MEIEAFSQGAMLGIFFHAFGHMVISELKLASTEPEEDAVDELSTILLSTVMIRVPESEGESYAQVIMGSALYLKFSAEELRAQDKGIPFHDEHPPDERRVANILCLAAGADPHHFFLTAAKAGILQDRLRRCAETYQERQAVWDELLARAVEGRKSRGMLTLEVVPSRNPTYRRFEQVFEQGGDFDQMLVFFVAMGRLPRDVPIVVKDCGVANGFWSPREAEIVLCYGRDLAHEALHLLLHQRMGLLPVVEIEDHLGHARGLDLLQRVDDVLRAAAQDRLVGELLRPHVAQDVHDVDEVPVGRRHLLARGRREGRDQSVLEIAHQRLLAVLLLLRRRSDMNEVRAHGPPHRPLELGLAGLAIDAHSVGQRAIDHGGGEGRVDHVPVVLRRKLH
ncbi:MAG: DUF4344 domain-containing metallopeptidase [Alphaproteobacteria bacterium]|nr:DUF4344 domain-containing metallopeptidase [Alphaproteobacteria bacterium]